MSQAHGAVPLRHGSAGDPWPYTLFGRTWRFAKIGLDLCLHVVGFSSFAVRTNYDVRG